MWMIDKTKTFKVTQTCPWMTDLSCYFLKCMWADGENSLFFAKVVSVVSYYIELAPKTHFIKTSATLRYAYLYLSH